MVVVGAGAAVVVVTCVVVVAGRVVVVTTVVVVASFQCPWWPLAVIAERAMESLSWWRDRAPATEMPVLSTSAVATK
jgi:hypothetical protein